MKRYNMFKVDVGSFGIGIVTVMTIFCVVFDGTVETNRNVIFIP